MIDMLDETRKTVAMVLGLALRALSQPGSLTRQQALDLAEVLEGQANVLREVAGAEP